MQNCHVCAGKLNTFISELKDAQTGDKFSLLVCENCGLGETHVSPENLAPYYADYHGKRHGFTTDYCAWRRIRWVEKNFRAGGKGKRILDIGCGDGSFLEAAKRRGWESVGTEMNRAKFRDSDLKVYGDLSEVKENYAPASFDAVTMWHTLEHFKNPREVIEKAFELLADDGYMLIAVPNYGGLQAQMFRQNWLHLDVPRHLFHFNFKSLETLLSQTGLKIKWHRHQEFEYDLLGWSQSALNALFATPNVFFRSLSAQTNGISSSEIALNLVFGTAFSALALPAVPLSALLKKGGTLVFCATKN